MAVGAFDGIHLGHQALLHRAEQAGAAQDLPCAVVTFDPLPAQYFSPTTQAQALTPLNDRLALLEEHGADLALVLEFTEPLAAMSGEEFVRQVLVGGLGGRHILFGVSHSLGKKGTFARPLLEKLAGELGFGAEVVPTVEVDGVPVTSSRIRDSLAAGQVDIAARLLGRPFAVEGKTVAGSGRGAQLGFPTLNIAPPEGQVLPAQGVYAGTATLGKQDYPSAISLGARPTFGGEGVCLEAHLLRFSGGEHGPVRLAFHAWLRLQERFASAAELTGQMAKDVEQVRSYFAGRAGAQ